MPTARQRALEAAAEEQRRALAAAPPPPPAGGPSRASEAQQRRRQREAQPQDEPALLGELMGHHVETRTHGLMNHACPYCEALHFLAERASNSSQAHPTFVTCCQQGLHAGKPILGLCADLPFQTWFKRERTRKHSRSINEEYAFVSTSLHQVSKF